MAQGDLPPLTEIQLAKALNDVARTGELVLREVRVQAEEFHQLVEQAVPERDGSHRRRLAAIRLIGVIVVGNLRVERLVCDELRIARTSLCGRLSLYDVQVLERVQLQDATLGIMRAERCRFEGAFRITDTVFEEDVHLGRSTYREIAVRDTVFRRRVRFSRAHFERGASFLSTRFEGDAWFDRMQIEGLAQFDGSDFAGGTSFRNTTFLGPTRFLDVRFERETTFRDVRFAKWTSFARATFLSSRQLGPLLGETLDFEGAVFAQPIRIELSAQRLQMERVEFQRGGDLFVHEADVELDGAAFSGPTLLASLLPSQHPRFLALGTEQHDADGSRSVSSEPAPRADPRVVSMRNAKVGDLTLSGVDLSACRFAGAHALDTMRIERSSFRRTPPGWRRRRRRLHWTRRQTIAEEHDWREAHGHGEEWDGSPREAIEPEQVAAIYRALRKAREDHKDEPGAADFYYGEMEMRRQAGWMSAARLSEAWVPTPRSTRTVLGLYWLVSGYGLRASRAFAALATTIALLAIPLDLWGFDPDRAYGRALLFAAESSVSLLRAPSVKLTASGEVLQLVLRIVGPLLFGLAALSLRGRVKR